MATQNFDTDLVGKFKNAKEVLAEGFKGLVPAFEASIDLARANGLPALESECQEGLTAAQTIKKQYEQLDESLDVLIEKYSKLQDAVEG